MTIVEPGTDSETGTSKDQTVAQPSKSEVVMEVAPPADINDVKVTVKTVETVEDATKTTMNSEQQYVITSITTTTTSPPAAGEDTNNASVNVPSQEETTTSPPVVTVQLSAMESSKVSTEDTGQTNDSQL